MNVLKHLILIELNCHLRHCNKPVKTSKLNNFDHVSFDLLQNHVFVALAKSPRSSTRSHISHSRPHGKREIENRRAPDWNWKPTLVATRQSTKPVELGHQRWSRVSMSNIWHRQFSSPKMAPIPCPTGDDDDDALASSLFSGDASGKGEIWHLDVFPN